MLGSNPILLEGRGKPPPSFLRCLIGAGDARISEVVGISLVREYRSFLFLKRNPGESIPVHDSNPL